MPRKKAPAPSAFDKAESILASSPPSPVQELDGLIEAIEEGYRVDNVPKESKKKSFAPSTLVWNHGVCPRYWYLAFEGNTFYEHKPGRAIANMDAGSDRHDRIQAAMTAAGIVVEHERKTLHEDPPISGYVDSFINWNNEQYIVEIKTCNDQAFQRHKQSKTASNYQILQLLIYMKIYKKRRGILMYENKNTHELYCVPIIIDNSHVQFVDYMFDWMRRVWKAWEDKTIPQVPFRSNTVKICNNCPLQLACQAAPEGVIQIERRKDEKGAF